MVAAPAELQAALQQARRSPRAAWYAGPQVDVQATGPYRHHVRKRRAYLEGVIDECLAERAPLANALDLGCGDGANLGWLGARVGRLYASDYNPDRLSRLPSNTGARAFLADVLDFPVADDSFDLVFFNHVLEHVPDDLAALAEVRRVLRPGGLLILGVPNEGAAFWQLAYRLQPRTRATTDHVHFYTADSIAMRCRTAGLAVRAVHPIGWGVPHWGIDAVLRQWRWIDDLLEAVGRRLCPSQATSLYLLATK
ncbi:MAG: class I SAM-dependent methyltransferase [Gammaproteobacteria bacterium]|nr:class I SAM-dependent methyltransferase [Gammaproteobacteria bacterium]